MYGGLNGSKICVEFEGELYMIKFPPKPSRNPEMSYTNSCVSEYIACHILETLGMDVQKTILGRYRDKVVVACKDFSIDGWQLKEFAMLKNTVIESSGNGYGTELFDVLDTIHKQRLFPENELEHYFWKLFVCDALVGNFDRHNGNWGFLVNEKTGSVKISPVYDCGSCLYPQVTDEAMESIIQSREEIEKRLFQFPASAIKENGVKICYYTFLTNTDNPSCMKAVSELFSKINLNQIYEIIDSTPEISNVHRRFLKKMLFERYSKILIPAYQHAAEKGFSSVQGYTIPNIKNILRECPHPEPDNGLEL
jgi:hypothetical protein